MEKSAENWALDVLQRTAAYTHPQDVAQSPAASTNNSSNSLIQASSRDDGVSGSASIMDSGNFGLPPVIEPTGQWQHDMQHKLAFSAFDVHQTPRDAEYQCASDNSKQEGGCAECTMNDTCTCDGFVRFGYGSKWSQWQDVSGSVTCGTSKFGDPSVGHGKLCMCMPHVYTCATEWSTPTANCTECTMQDRCSCLGQVRLGYNDKWTDWVPSLGATTCKVSEFGLDPYEGHGKICECQPSMKMMNDMTTPAGVGVILKSLSAVTFAYFAAATLYNFFGNCDGYILYYTLEVLMSTMRLAPMLCAVFLAVIKRAQTLTDESLQLFGLPQEYIKVAIAFCAFTFIIQAVFFTFAEYFAQKQSVTGHMFTPNSSKVKTLSSLGDFSLTLMYGFLIVALVGVLSMSEPQILYQQTGRTSVAPGTVCTIILACVYFAVYIILHIMKGFQEPGEAEVSSYFLETMKLASATLNLAPMMSAQFLAVQIAADWEGIFLPHNIKVCIYVCTTSLLVQVALVVVTPALSGASLQASGSRGDMDFVTRSHSTFVVVSVIRWLAIFALYISVGIIAISLWKLNLVSTLTHLLIVLMGIFFAVYIALWLSVTIRQLMRGGLYRTTRTLALAKDGAMISPMLFLLFLGSWVHAHEMENPLGEPGKPQSWAQVCMYVAACALVCMLLMIMLRGLRARRSTDLDTGYDIMDRSSSGWFLAVSLPMLVLCLSSIGVMVGLFTITPETA